MGTESERVAGFGRLEEGLRQASDWYLWGPYLSERQWGTVREDYSADGEAWGYLPHDHARSRAYRWGEDGLAGFCDIEQRLCLGLALWNGRDPILKERAFGLTGAEGNHGEDVKEYWWYLDAVPSHAWNRWRYHYPQLAFPYEDLRARTAGEASTTRIMATGELGQQQLSALPEALAATRGTFRIVLVHHPLVSTPNHYLRRLTDAAELHRVLAAHGAELVLHGHDHCRALIWLDSPERRIPVVGVPSASARASHGDKDAGGYNLFRIDGEAGNWRCEMIGRQRAPDGTVGEVARQMLTDPR